MGAAEHKGTVHTSRPTVPGSNLGAPDSPTIEIFLRKVDSNHPTPPAKKTYSLNISALMPVHYGQRSKNTLLG